MVVKLQSLTDLEQQLTINNVELFKVYKKGAIKNITQYPQIKESDRTCYVAFNTEYKKYSLYSSVCMIVDRLKQAYQHTDNSYIVPLVNTFYYVDCGRTEMLIPKTMIFKSELYGEIDDELEIVFFKNLMAQQFENECKKRGIRQ